MAELSRVGESRFGRLLRAGAAGAVAAGAIAIVTPGRTACAMVFRHDVSNVRSYGGARWGGRRWDNRGDNDWQVNFGLNDWGWNRGWNRWGVNAGWSDWGWRNPGWGGYGWGGGWNGWQANPWWNNSSWWQSPGWDYWGGWNSYPGAYTGYYQNPVGSYDLTTSIQMQQWEQAEQERAAEAQALAAQQQKMQNEINAAVDSEDSGYTTGQGQREEEQAIVNSGVYGFGGTDRTDPSDYIAARAPVEPPGFILPAGWNRSARDLGFMLDHTRTAAYQRAYGDGSAQLGGETWSRYLSRMLNRTGAARQGTGTNVPRRASATQPAAAASDPRTDPLSTTMHDAVGFVGRSAGGFAESAGNGALSALDRAGGNLGGFASEAGRITGKALGYGAIGVGSLAALGIAGIAGLGAARAAKDMLRR